MTPEQYPDPAAIQDTREAFSDHAQVVYDMAAQVQAAAHQVSTGDSALDAQVAELMSVVTAAIDGTGGRLQDASAALEKMAQLVAEHGGQQDTSDGGRQAH